MIQKLMIPACLAALIGLPVGLHGASQWRYASILDISGQRAESGNFGCQHEGAGNNRRAIAFIQIPDPTNPDQDLGEIRHVSPYQDCPQLFRAARDAPFQIAYFSDKPQRGMVIADIPEHKAQYGLRAAIGMGIGFIGALICGLAFWRRRQGYY